MMPPLTVGIAHISVPLRFRLVEFPMTWQSLAEKLGCHTANSGLVGLPRVMASCHLCRNWSIQLKVCADLCRNTLQVLQVHLNTTISTTFAVVILQPAMTRCCPPDRCHRIANFSCFLSSMGGGNTIKSLESAIPAPCCWSEPEHPVAEVPPRIRELVNWPLAVTPLFLIPQDTRKIMGKL
jgi:hypothetical protein